MAELSLPLMAAATRTAEHVWSIRETSLHSYLTARAAGTVQRATKPIGVPQSTNVAVFSVRGVIVPHAEWSDEVDATQLTKALREAASADHIDAVLLDIDSPGGSTAGLAELVDAARELEAVKPLYSQIVPGGCCCSAAYRLASQSTAIFAGNRDDIGSIGTRSLIYDWSGWFQQAGVEAIASDTGPLKSLGVMGLPVTDEQRAFLQQRVDYLQQDFKADLVAGRGFTDEEYEAVATGGYWFGEQALELKLIDGLQSREATMAALQSAITTRKGATQMAENTTTVEAPKAATSKEIKDAFPNSTAEFREEMTEKGKMIGEVAVAWAQKCEESLAAEKAAREQAEAKVAKGATQDQSPAKSTRGVATVASVTQADAPDEDPVQRLNEITDGLVQSCGSRFEAYRQACKRNPELARAARELHAPRR